jgi:excisionase family DNA binding protein
MMSFSGQLAPIAVAPKDLPALTGLGMSKIKELLSTGEIPSIRCGRRRVVPMAQLSEWLQRRLAEDTKDAA